MNININKKKKYIIIIIYIIRVRAFATGKSVPLRGGLSWLLSGGTFVRGSERRKKIFEDGQRRAKTTVRKERTTPKRGR